mgnify:CR=1 FL=1
MAKSRSRIFVHTPGQKPRVDTRKMRQERRAARLAASSSPVIEKSAAGQAQSQQKPKEEKETQPEVTMSYSTFL